MQANKVSFPHTVADGDVHVAAGVEIPVGLLALHPVLAASQNKQLNADALERQAARAMGAKKRYATFALWHKDLEEQCERALLDGNWPLRTRLRAHVETVIDLKEATAWKFAEEYHWHVVELWTKNRWNGLSVDRKYMELVYKHGKEEKPQEAHASYRGRQQRRGGRGGARQQQQADAAFAPDSQPSQAGAARAPPAAHQYPRGGRGGRQGNVQSGRQ